MYRRYVEVDNGIGRRQAPVGVLAPLEVESALGSSEGNPREGVSIAHERLSRLQTGLERLDRLPPIRRKKKVHSSVVCPITPISLRMIVYVSTTHLATRSHPTDIEKVSSGAMRTGLFKTSVKENIDTTLTKLLAALQIRVDQ